ncbi:hypothetical protein [Amycolatopsis sp.]|uniref:hypothetical protein n=1 Tax=Amycolatopsis sp. TaxID=37632 RepID=UPI002D15704F|nr:hypothetical protein [Amycolatopsis sp.]HVV12311.1 hypothetical protein [Amycolatopsis sp.]
MRPGKIRFLAVLAGLCAILAGCGQPPVDTAATQPGGPGLSKDDVDRQDATSRWANDYCIAVGSLVDGLATMPSIDPSTPRRTVQTSSDLLASMIGGLDKTVQQLRTLPAAPVPEAATARDSAVAQFAGIRARAATAKQHLDAAGAATTVDQDTLGEAQGPLAEVSKVDVLAGLNSVPTLATAAAHAPVCQQLTARETS